MVDVANVMGSRPDGWWRDRAGAAVRLHADLVRLAASGRAEPPGEDALPGQAVPPGEDAFPGQAVPPGQAAPPGFVMVLEGAANAAAARISAATGLPAASGGDTPVPGAAPAPGEVRVVQARGSGDDAIVTVVRDLPGRRIVVTADRELRQRSAAAGATILGPGWLLGLLRA